jgi:hypothetical protein
MKLLAFAVLLFGLATSACAFLPVQKNCDVLTGLESKFYGMCAWVDKGCSTVWQTQPRIFYYCKLCLYHSGIRS